MKLTPAMYSYTVILVLVVVVFVMAINRNGPTMSMRNQDYRSLMNPCHCMLAPKGTLQEGPGLELMARFSNPSAPLPAAVDNWNSLVPVVDQGNWGSCTAFSMRYAYMLWALRTNGSLPSEPSVAYWYAQSRLKLSNGALNDTGSTTAATVWVLATLGTPTNAQWPYTAANVFVRPTISSSLLAVTRTNVPEKVTVYSNSANTLTALKTVLQSGRTLLASILVYSSMMTVKVFVSGTVPMPNTRRESVQGGHAIAVTGYDDRLQHFRFRNSWGSYDGINGEYTIPYAYLTNPSLVGSFYAF